MSYSITGLAGLAGIFNTVSSDLNMPTSAAYHALNVLAAVSGLRSIKLPLPLCSLPPEIMYLILELAGCAVFSVL